MILEVIGDRDDLALEDDGEDTCAASLSATAFNELRLGSGDRSGHIVSLVSKWRVVS